MSNKFDPRVLSFSTITELSHIFDFSITKQSVKMYRKKRSKMNYVRYNLPTRKHGHHMSKNAPQVRVCKGELQGIKVESLTKTVVNVKNDQYI